MIRSLRWRLQTWHALVLTTVLVIFGGFVYALQWQTRLQNMDAELDRVASVLMSRLRGLFPAPRMPPRPRGPGPQRDDRPPEPIGVLPLIEPVGNPEVPVFRDYVRIWRDDTNEPRRGDGRGNPRDAFRDGFRDGPRDGPREWRDGPRDGRDSPGRNSWMSQPRGLGLPEEFKHLFEGDDESSFYFIIWDRSGTVLEKSKSVEEIPFPDLHTTSDGIPVRMVRMRELQREVIHVSRFDINVLVGRSIRPDLAALHRSGMFLVLTGLGVLAIGLAGGWWFSSHAIRPIAEMSTIAKSISAKSLSTRINVQSTATELEQLAIVLNQTFDRLQSAFERQGQFTADASHELRTPLAVILSHAELALSRTRSVEEYQTAFNACRRASLRMKTLIDSLLLLARFDTGQPEIHRAPVDLGRLAEDAAEMLQPLAVERHVELQCHPMPVTVAADRDRLFQVLTNLLTNAIRYNRADGKVDLDVTSDGQSAILRVRDTGVGIAAADLPRIFDRFFRVDKVRTTAEGGCGLGLSICQTIIEAHRGTITATSELNVGTTIEIRLPLTVALNRSMESATLPTQTEPAATSA